MTKKEIAEGQKQGETFMGFLRSAIRILDEEREKLTIERDKLNRLKHFLEEGLCSDCKKQFHSPPALNEI